MKSNKVEIKEKGKCSTALTSPISAKIDKRPSSSKFSFKPKMFAHLSDYVQEVDWDAVKKTLTLTIAETAEFDAFKWMMYIEYQNHEIQKSPFIDIDSNCAILEFFDNFDNVIAEFRMKNLILVSHECNLGSWCNTESLTYSIEVSYQYGDMVMPKKKLPQTNQEITDQEWKTDEAP
jgi:hypothetical protein